MSIPKLNQETIDTLKLKIESEIYRRSLYEFFVASTKILYPQVDWDYAWFFRWLCDEVLQPEVERIQRKEDKTQDIIINMPFRAGKSILVSQILPVWVWIRDASASIMQVSHSETLAIKHSHASKMLVESEWFQQRFPDITLREDTHSKNNYMTNQGGKRISFGIKSGIIGEGVDYFQIIDDINSPSDSIAVTNTINEIYTDTLYSRLNNNYAVRLILQQRVATADICGFLLEKNPDKYFHVCLPARLGANVSPSYLSQYYTNGLLWENRFSDKKLLDFQTTLGSRAYSGQLMQKPQSVEGQIIKRQWLRIMSHQDFKTIAGNEKIVWQVFIDSAYTSKQTNDATAVVIAARVGNSVYVLRAWKFWLEFPQLIIKLKEMASLYNVKLIYVESKASGLSIIQQMRNDGFNVTDLKPKDKDKVSRTNAVTPIIEGGRFVLLEDTSNNMVIDELCAFPDGADDITDAVVYSIDTLLNKTKFNYAM